MRVLRCTVVTLTSLLVLTLARPAFAGDRVPRTSDSEGLVGEAERWITAAAAAYRWWPVTGVALCGSSARAPC